MMLEPTQRKFSPEEHAQLAALQQRQAGRDLDARMAASEMALRQWCVEQALKAHETHAVEALCKLIFDFVTAPIKPEVQK